MKKMLIIFVVLFASNSFAWKAELTPKQRETTKETKAKIEAIELIEGKPKKKFQKISPIWATATTMPQAIKKAKTDAYKAGANAIIEFQFGTRDASASGAFSFTPGTGSAYGVAAVAPVVQGWAVKWIE